MKLGSLKRVPLREVWKNEARDFSKWLATKEGISLLGEAVGFEIEPTETQVISWREFLGRIRRLSLRIRLRTRITIISVSSSLMRPVRAPRVRYGLLKKRMTSIDGRLSF